MLTFFTTPKPFQGIFDVIQRNAIESWVHVCPACEIILLGKENGTGQVAKEYGLRHIPSVACNEYGTPLISSMFKEVEKTASQPLLCYLNADIMLLPDFLPAVNNIRAWRHRFMISGRRWNIDLRERWDFTDPFWAPRLKAYVEKQGHIPTPVGMDYFVFPRGLWWQIPSFTVGRPAWDNWMIFRARSLKIPVIDATQVITAIHQNHPPTYVKEGEKLVHYFEGVEAKRNRMIAGSSMCLLFGFYDSTHTLSYDGLHPTFTMTRQNFIRHILTMHLVSPNSPLGLLSRILYIIARSARLISLGR